MTTKTSDPLNIPILSKKYKYDVRKLIRSWKNGKSDLEIAQSLGVDIHKIQQVRQEISFIYERDRQKNLKDARRKGLLQIKKSTP